METSIKSENLIFDRIRKKNMNFQMNTKLYYVNCGVYNTNLWDIVHIEM